MNYTSAPISAVREAVTAMIMLELSGSAKSTNWQSVADMIVTRYVDKIAYLASGEITSFADLRFEAERAMRSFVDYALPNRSAEVSRCKDHFIAWTSRLSESTAARAIIEVNTIICKTLSSISHSRLDRLSHGLALAQALKQWFAWTKWKKCKGWQSNEVCFIPLWP